MKRNSNQDKVSLQQRFPFLFFPVSFPCNCQQLDLNVTFPYKGLGVGFKIQAQFSSVTSVCVSVIYKLYIYMCVYACVCTRV